MTLGGGTAIEKFSAAVPSGSGLKTPASSQLREHPRLDLRGLVAGAVLEGLEAVGRHGAWSLGAVMSGPRICT